MNSADAGEENCSLPSSGVIGRRDSVMTRIVSFIESRSAAYRRLPRWLRWTSITFAIVVGVVGVVSMVTPLAVLEVGTILVSLSLGVLSLEFDRARRLLLYLTQKMTDRATRRRMLFGVGIILVAYLSVFALVLAK